MSDEGEYADVQEDIVTRMRDVMLMSTREYQKIRADVYSRSVI